MKKYYVSPVLSQNENADILRTSGLGLFNPQNAAEQQTLDDYLAGYGVKSGIAKYTN